MGANQSRPSDAAINEKLIERLQALQMKDERRTSEKDGFIVVEGEARKSSGRCSWSSKPDLEQSPKIYCDRQASTRCVYNYGGGVGKGAHGRSEGSIQTLSYLLSCVLSCDRTDSL